MHYFGKVADDEKGKAALEKWLADKDELLAGRIPRAVGDGLTIRDLCNRFLTNRQAKMETGELSAVSFYDYHAVCQKIVKAFGPTRLVADLDASDFESFRRKLAKNYGPVTLANNIQRVRVVFRYAEQNQLVPVAVRYGTEFKKPSRKVMRLERAKHGVRMYEADELRLLLDKATIPLKTMILLGVNCGLGNTDIAYMPTTAVNLKTGWLNYPRPKTGIPRRCPLWRETIDSIRETLDKRPKPKKTEHDGLLFITKYGQPWGTRSCTLPDAKGKVRKNTDDPICKEFNKLLVALKIKRHGLSFYALRRCFETIGGDARDQVAVNSIMGHADDSMAATYRERIDDTRLVAVVQHVRTWLFGSEENK